ncbi:conjugal transfer protein VirC2 [Agrobacterium vitis]|uniref:Virulence protein n=4 Tax=Agrobacterium TaxID=357 RepID=A0A2Z2PXY8_AGRTU|nr:MULTISPECIES: conjugal transfer protein VirC2 [Rhizobium/Agrobacterium group]MCF1501135.1 conjugal transfer protein VirC2 [Allorhizobium sp. Av2]ASK46348.1 virulence protein [Agrobacterium vitis]ASK47051.1 virulence protein [Agrobacterium radiobacter]KAA3509396.1 virulence protein [Agrobacterium vitis]KAA3522438.1 conjugal transfer protein VirC2 [Agrobacterium vitis]
MGIRKPVLSVEKARQLAVARTETVRPLLPIAAPNLAVSQFSTDIDLAPRQSRPAATRHDHPDQHPTPTVDALSAPAGSEKVQVFLSARPPAPDVSAVYDNLIRQYSPCKSLQMILRRALSDFEIMLADGSFRAAPKSYPVRDITPEKSILVQTSRMFPVSLLQVARSHFDPVGLETARAFGQKLATAALASFFAGEKTRR